MDFRTGGDLDINGCKASAGYRWSRVMQECVRPWEAGMKFDLKDEAAFAIFSADSSKVEVMLNGADRLCKRSHLNRNMWVDRRMRTFVIREKDGWKLLMHYHKKK